MDDTAKAARARLSVLKLAAKLGNVAEACRQRRVERSSFYQWKRRFAEGGLAGLKDKPAQSVSHPHATPDDRVEQIKQLSLAHPAMGCNKLEQILRNDGVRVSAVTVQKILNDAGIGTGRKRCRHLERARRDGNLDLSCEQIGFIEDCDPEFRDRNLTCAAPGDLIHADTIFVGARKGMGRLYLHVAVDGWSSFAFGVLSLTNDSDVAIGLLEAQVLPFFIAAHFVVKAVLTGRGREFSGPGWHPYPQFLARAKIAHIPAAGPQSGTIERFRRVVVADFFRSQRALASCQDIAALQRNFDAWLTSYNTEQRHTGYRNDGVTPADLIISQAK